MALKDQLDNARRSSGNSSEIKVNIMTTNNTNCMGGWR